MAKKGPNGQKVPLTVRKMLILSYTALKCNVFRFNRAPYIPRNSKLTIPSFQNGVGPFLRALNKGEKCPLSLKNVTFLYRASSTSFQSYGQVEYSIMKKNAYK